jgi:hypothetical protein
VRTVFIAHSPLKEIVMIAVKSWIVLLASRPIATVASLLGRKHENMRQAHSVELQQWENEGGNSAPSSDTPDAIVTTGCA